MDQFDRHAIVAAWLSYQLLYLMPFVMNEHHLRVETAASDAAACDITRSICRSLPTRLLLLLLLLHMAHPAAMPDYQQSVL